MLSFNCICTGIVRRKKGRGREEGEKRERGEKGKVPYPLSPIPLPFSLPPYPLPLSTPENKNNKPLKVAIP